MKLSKANSTIILIFTCTAILVSFFPFSQISAGTNEISQSSSLSYVSHEPITIDSDDDFVSIGCIGNGTVEDPYIIENFSVNNISASVGISIINVTKYFIIQHCRIEVDYRGIEILGLPDYICTIYNNTFISCSYGIFIAGTDYALIVQNTFTDNERHGIDISHSDNLLIDNNTFYDSLCAIYLFYSDDAIICNNTCSNSFDSTIIGRVAENLTIVQNSINEPGYYPLYLYSIQKGLIAFNNFTSSDYSCNINYCSNLNIRNNLFKDMQDYGLFLYYCEASIVYHNIFMNNYKEGENSQAYNIEHTNTHIPNYWYNEVLQEGNFWSNYIGYGNYEIAGGICSDIYPLVGKDSDSDGLGDICETNIYGTNINNPDTDSDQLSDYDEVAVYQTNPLDIDSDRDFLTDHEEIFTYHTNPNSVDSDSDGLKDKDEIFEYNTSPINSDTDFDLMPDGWEIENGLNPLDPNDANQDADSDGLVNYEEYNFNTDVNCIDTDHDGLTDYEEISTYGTIPTNPDSDGDGRLDGQEITDGTDPLVPDEPAKTSSSLLGLVLCIIVISFIFSFRRRKY